MAAATALAAGGLVSIPSGHHTTTAPPETATAVISGEIYITAVRSRRTFYTDRLKYNNVSCAVYGENLQGKSKTYRVFVLSCTICLSIEMILCIIRKFFESCGDRSCANVDFQNKSLHGYTIRTGLEMGHFEKKNSRWKK